MAAGPAARVRLIELADADVLAELYAANREFLATQAVAAMLDIAWSLGLHRVEAGTLVENHASQRVLTANGFTRYGLAPAYLRIDDRWQDHILFQVLNPADAQLSRA